MNSESTNGSHYFFYCKPDQADFDMGNRSDGAHMASDQFGKLNVGDVVWSITCIKSRLYAFHRLVVATIKTQSQLDDEAPNNNRWRASHHVFANAKTPLIGVELTDIAPSLRFDGTVTKLPDKFNGRNFQSMRMLTPESVALVQRHWDDVPKQPVEPILDAIREMEEVEFLIHEYAKENAKLHCVQTNRLITLHILLVSGGNAAVGLKRIADSLQHIAHIHELHLMGDIINDTVICCLQGLDNVSRIVCHDTIVSNSGCQILSNLLDNTSVKSLHHNARKHAGGFVEEYYYDLAMVCICEFGTPETAIDLLSIELTYSPSNYIALNRRGACFADLGNFDLAIADCNEAIKLCPTESYCYLERAQVWQMADEHEPALEDLTKAIGIDEADASFYEARAESHEALDMLDEAIEDCSTAIDLGTEDMDTYLLRGNIYYELYLLEEAETDFNYVLDMEPYNSIALFRRGRVYYNADKFEDAIDDYTMSLQIDPSWEDYAERGKCYFDLGEYDDALDDLNDALAIFPENTDVLVNRARCNYSLSEYGNAIDDCSRVMDLDPQKSVALLWRGRCYSETKQRPLAIDDFSRGIAIDPEDAYFFVERGIAYQATEHYEEAISDFNKTIDLARRDAKEYDLPMHEAEYCITAFEHRGKCYEIIKMHEERIDNEKEASAVGINIEDCDDN